MTKQKIKKEVGFVGRIIFGAFIFVAVAGTSIWALAAFTEPIDTPGNSVQDFAKNIMGANNADNAFNSDSVIANSNGSMIERLEDIGLKLNPTAMTVKSGSTMTHATAATYCRNLSAVAEFAIDGSNTSTTYTNWRLGTINELAIFEGITADTAYVWSTTLKSTANGTWMRLRVSDGDWGTNTYSYSNFVRCVR